jgi:hypothetical protein
VQLKSQEPDAQVATEFAGAAQVVQEAPAEPHLAGVGACMQVVPSQQPPPQLLQVVPVTHEPELQTSPTPHVLHMAPPVPHFIADGVCTHMVPSQQPPQLAGPQVVAVTHAPPRQV